MKNLLAIISLVVLTNCSLPLVGSVGTSSVTGVVTGKYTHSAVTTVVDIATYEKTGKTSATLINLIDRIRMLDNDLIRLKTKIDTLRKKKSKK